MLKLLTVLCILILFSGCQLALEGEGALRVEDNRLAGVLVTNDSLHTILFDESQVFRSIDEMLAPRRLYAEHITTTHTSPETGMEYQRDEFVFPGVEGIQFFTTVLYTGAGSSFVNMGDSAISDGHTGVHVTDNSHSVTMEGSIYVLPGIGGQAFFVNPVFQTADGRLFVEQGGGFSLGGVTDEGSWMSQTQTHTTTITENGVETINTTSVTINISAMFESEKITVIQMCEDSQIISRNDFAPNEMPDEIHAESQTAFFLVEAHRPAATANPIRRELYGPNDNSIRTFIPRPDGIFEARDTVIVWG